MKMQKRWRFFLGLILIFLSAFFYFVHYLIFRDAHHIFIYLIGDIAFVFLEVLLVTLVIHELLVYREKQSLLKKMNMAIGVFYSEVGVQLLKIFSHFLKETSLLETKLQCSNEWNKEQFLKAQEYFSLCDLPLESHRGDLALVKEFLLEKRPFLLNLLANPNLLEHESFTNCLWAVFHLTEELSFRQSFNNLPENDYKHLSGDIKRAYRLLLCQWISYMRHLRRDYPFLYSLAIRTNPFDKKATVVIS